MTEGRRSLSFLSISRHTSWGKAFSFFFLIIYVTVQHILLHYQLSLRNIQLRTARCRRMKSLATTTEKTAGETGSTSFDPILKCNQLNDMFSKNAGFHILRTILVGKQQHVFQESTVEL